MAMPKLAAVVLPVLLVFNANCRAASDNSVTIFRDGVPALPIVAGSTPAAVEELQKKLEQIFGARLPAGQRGGPGVYVGLASDFGIPPADVEGLGSDGFIQRSDGKSLYLIAREADGVYYAVVTLLQQLGCRWFFPGKEWEVIPKLATFSGNWNERQVPSFARWRNIAYGFGTYAKCRGDLKHWLMHNRMGESEATHTGSHNKEFVNLVRAKSEDLLAKGGKGPGGTKLCYSHPELIKFAVSYAVDNADRRARSIMPTDGLGFCECARCVAAANVKSTFRKNAMLFGRQASGTDVCVTSETYFGLINTIAAAATAKNPDMRVATRVYSGYTHPPSFNMHPNVDVIFSRMFRRTPLSLEEQLKIWSTKTSGARGIKDYLSVYQFDWDGPNNPDEVQPYWIQTDFRIYAKYGLNQYTSEASNNWAPRGVGYYAIAQLLWNVDADIGAVLKDFYASAFGPAARTMERYYERWYGFEKAKAAASAVKSFKLSENTPENLKASVADLDEAAAILKNHPQELERINLLRMYLHTLVLRKRQAEAITRKDEKAIIESVKDETLFVGRLAHTNMVHSIALLEDTFERRYEKILEVLNKATGSQGRVESLARGWHKTHCGRTRGALGCGHEGTRSPEKPRGRGRSCRRFQESACVHVGKYTQRFAKFNSLLAGARAAFARCRKRSGKNAHAQRAVESSESRRAAARGSAAGCERPAKMGRGFAEAAQERTSIRPPDRSLSAPVWRPAPGGTLSHRGRERRGSRDRSARQQASSEVGGLLDSGPREARQGVGRRRKRRVAHCCSHLLARRRTG